ncbi:MAG: coproporphyrinogen III oxidase family protein [Clostridia bacterium]|nr:coproporphyrinogen III oxidase family protein [Clostridia bacterium]
MTMIDFIKNNDKSPSFLGIYIHIPFCRTKCLYCDFCSFVSRSDGEREEYVSALLKEIEARGTKEYLVDTIYFGGGTPSLLSSKQIGRILSALRENFVVCEDVEITLECNPMISKRDVEEAVPYGDGLDLRDVEDVAPYGVEGYFAQLRRIGVNRLSIGIQSAIDSELKLIGRRHTFEEAKRTFFAARESGFENISVDLMFGIPSQTMESLEISLRQFISLGAEHISIYSLQLEEGTPLYRLQDRYIIPDDDVVASMYENVVSLMKEAGYSHYEISNFAKEDRESRHNSKYWRLDEYLGLGVAAHSDFGGKRLENTKDMAKYLSGECVENELVIGESEREFEFLMLGLRTSEGISKSEFLHRFGIDFDVKYGEKVKKLEKMGYFWQNDDRIALNERGFEVSNMILAQILDFDY